jgi:hypothetical protein
MRVFCTQHDCVLNYYGKCDSLEIVLNPSFDNEQLLICSEYKEVDYEVEHDKQD